MASFFDRMLGRNKGTSATAKDRLRFVLQYDRINIPPEKMEEMKREILEVISKYVAIDRERVDIALEQRDRQSSKLIAEIPFSNDQKIIIGKSLNEDSDRDDSTQPIRESLIDENLKLDEAETEEPKSDS